MAQEDSPPVSIVINVEVEVFAIERILILLIPFARSTTGLGFILTNFLAALKSISSPPSRASAVFDCLFWVERVACALLWWSFVEGIHGRCWYAAVFLFNFSNMVLLISNSDVIQRRFRLRPSPIVSEIKLKKQVAELGTQTEVVDSPDQQRCIVSEVKEEAKETNEEGKDLGASDDQNGSGIKTEVDCNIEFKSMNGSTAMVDENNDSDTDINICLKLEIGGKKELRITKVEVKDAAEKEEESYSYSYLKLMNSLYNEQLMETREGWEDRLNEEIQLRVSIIYQQITYLRGFIVDIEWLIEQIQAIACSWQKEKEELERRMKSTIAVCENLQRENDEERWAWEEERNDFVGKIAAFEVERERFEEERVVLESRAAEAREETLKSKMAMDELEENLMSSMMMTVSGSFVKVTTCEEKMSEMEAEKREMGRKLQEQEALTEECKALLQQSVEKGLELEEENRCLAEMFETMATTNDFNEIMEALRMKCDELEEENKVLDERLHSMTEMSEFYRNVMRNSHFRG